MKKKIVSTYVLKQDWRINNIKETVPKGTKFNFHFMQDWKQIEDDYIPKKYFKEPVYVGVVWPKNKNKDAQVYTFNSSFKELPSLFKIRDYNIYNTR